MRTKWTAVNLALLMIISTTLAYMVDFEKTNQIHEEDLEENSQVSSVDSRSQTHGEWKFDTTQFAMLEGDDGVLYPCKSSIGISTLGSQYGSGVPVDPHAPQGSGTAWANNQYHQICLSMDADAFHGIMDWTKMVSLGSSTDGRWNNIFSALN